MDTVYAFPGSFDPPTYGHLDLLKRACDILPEVVVVCSENSEKEHRFDAAKRLAFWMSYDLPRNCRLMTLQSALKDFQGKRIVMVRGLRGADDFAHEQKVMDYNKAHFGITEYFYLLANPEFEFVSSSKAWGYAQGLELSRLAKVVSPQCVGEMIKKVKQFKNLFLVVGRPGGGKSTFLKKLVEHHSDNVHINTDDINATVKTLLESAFPGENLINLAASRPDELVKVTASAWLAELAKRLLEAPLGKHVYVEVAYGLNPPYDLYRYLGADVIYIGCDESANRSRVISRGTSKHMTFVDIIFDLGQCHKIAKEKNLRLAYVNTGCDFLALDDLIADFDCKKGALYES